MSQKPNSKPIQNFRVGGIQASIWRNPSGKGDHNAARYSVRIHKRFHKKGDGTYATTDYFFPDDLPRLVLVALKAFEYIALNQSKDPGETTPV